MTTTRTIPTEVIDYLGRHHVITVSTPSFTGMPHADTVVYVNDDVRLYFYVIDGSTLARNIHDSKYVSFTIDDYLADWRKLRELQGVGRGFVVDVADVQHAESLVAAKFGPTFVAPPGRLHALAPIEMHFVDYDNATVAPRSGPDVANWGFRLDNPSATDRAVPVATSLGQMVFEAGEVIFRPGDQADEYYVIVEGSVEIRCEGFGADQTVTRVGPGQMFGGNAVLRRQPGGLTAHAVSRTVVLTVERDAVRNLVMPRDE